MERKRRERDGKFVRGTAKMRRDGKGEGKWDGQRGTMISEEVLWREREREGFK